MLGTKLDSTTFSRFRAAPISRLRRCTGSGEGRRAFPIDRPGIRGKRPGTSCPGLRCRRAVARDGQNPLAVPRSVPFRSLLPPVSGNGPAFRIMSGEARAVYKTFGLETGPDPRPDTPSESADV